jgi:Arc/MetJ-type ribon-helix-helix transcriptional regulator
MCGKMANNGYVSTSIPENIHKALTEIVGDEESLYTSVSDLMKEALREKIITIRSQTIVPGKKKK